VSPRQGATTANALTSALDESDGATRRNIQTVIEHVRAEVAGELEALMDTLVADPVYHIWGASKSVGPRGQQEVRDNYVALIRSGKNRLVYDVTRVVADETCVVTEGHFRFAYPGVVLGSARVDGDQLLDDHWYLVEYKCVVLWPMDEHARILGEELYAGEAPRVMRHLDDHELQELGPVGRANGVVNPGWV